MSPNTEATLNEMNGIILDHLAISVMAVAIIYILISILQYLSESSDAELIGWKPKKKLVEDIPELYSYFITIKKLTSIVNSKDRKSLIADYKYVIGHLNEFGPSKNISMTFLKNKPILIKSAETLKELKYKNTATAKDIKKCVLEEILLINIELVSAVQQHGVQIKNAILIDGKQERAQLNNIIEKRSSYEKL